MVSAILMTILEGRNDSPDLPLIEFNIDVLVWILSILREVCRLAFVVPAMLLDRAGIKGRQPLTA